MEAKKQIEEIEKNAKNVNCPVILSDINKKYRELTEIIDQKID